MSETRGHLIPATIYQSDESGNPVSGGTQVDCMFNPYEYSISKANTYTEKYKKNANVPRVEFSRAGAQTLTLKLTFDGYEKGESLSKTANKLWKLMELNTERIVDGEKKMTPPDVTFEWGIFSFVAVITNMTQHFTLFKPDGTPVRATVDVTFTQYQDLNDYKKRKQNPTSGGGPIQRVWRVTAGDRIDTIAHEVYGDASKWRLIAETNHIANPLALKPGQQLMIPLD